MPFGRRRSVRHLYSDGGGAHRCFTPTRPTRGCCWCSVRSSRSLGPGFSRGLATVTAEIYPTSVRAIAQGFHVQHGAPRKRRRTVPRRVAGANARLRHGVLAACGRARARRVDMDLASRNPWEKPDELRRSRSSHMSVEIKSGPAALADFVANAATDPAARERAATAFSDTIGVMLAGAASRPHEWRSRWPPRKAAASAASSRHQSGRSAGVAALANGVAAHALDYDDMCFVSLAHPSCALVPAIAGRGRARARAGRRRCSTPMSSGSSSNAGSGNVMNPRHYHQRGWHCTSSIGTLGAAAAAARVLGLDAHAVRTRARDRGLVGVRAEGKHRQHGQAAARGHGRAQRRDGGAAGAARVHREPARDRRTAGIPGGHGQRAARRSTPRWPISASAGKSSRPASRSSCIRRAPPRIRRSTRCSS